MTGEQFELFPRTNQDAVIPRSEKKSVTFLPCVSATKVEPSKFGQRGMVQDASAVPFPADRQVAYVIKIARALDGREERLAAKYWRTECNRLAARLQVQGFDAATIRAEIVRFGNAVARHRAKNDQQRPGGAA